MRIRDWSSDVCSSDLPDEPIVYVNLGPSADTPPSGMHTALFDAYSGVLVPAPQFNEGVLYWITRLHTDMLAGLPGKLFRSEEHTSELQSLMRTSYAVFCLKKKKSPRTISTADATIPLRFAS